MVLLTSVCCCVNQSPALVELVPLDAWDVELSEPPVELLVVGVVGCVVEVGLDGVVDAGLA